MTDTVAIVTAMKQMLTHQFPSRKIYIGQVPKTPQNPAFLLDLAHSEQSPANFETMKMQHEFHLYFLETEDPNGDIDGESLFETRQQVATLFFQNGVTVSGRTISVVPGVSKDDDGIIFVTLKTEYFELKNNTTDSTPLAESVETNLKLKG